MFEEEGKTGHPREKNPKIRVAQQTLLMTPSHPCFPVEMHYTAITVSYDWIAIKDTAFLE